MTQDEIKDLFIYIDDIDVETFKEENVNNLTAEYISKIIILGASEQILINGNLYDTNKVYIGDPEVAPESAEVIVDITRPTVVIYTKADLDNKYYTQEKLSSMLNNVSSGGGGISADVLNDYYTGNYTDTLLAQKENVTNKVTVINDSVTDTQYPSALSVYNLISTVKPDTEVVTLTTSTAELEPNVYYVFNLSGSQNINITLKEPKSNDVYSEYMFEFKTGGSTVSLTLPSTVDVMPKDGLKINAYKTYQVSILNNIAIILEV